MITVAKLIACGIEPTQARLFAEPLFTACERHQINTRVRVAAFVAQCAHESQLFTKLEESLYYRDAERIKRFFSNVTSLAIAQRLVRNPQALANVAYANRIGNGNEASGDGWKFRGRGLIQLTGRANYRDASVSACRSYVDHPDLVAQPLDACETAAWFWEHNGLNVLADASNTDAITRKINPAMLGYMERRELFREALEAMA